MQVYLSAPRPRRDALSACGGGRGEGFGSPKRAFERDRPGRKSRGIFRSGGRDINNRRFRLIPSPPPPGFPPQFFPLGGSRGAGLPAASYFPRAELRASRFLRVSDKGGLPISPPDY